MMIYITVAEKTTYSLLVAYTQEELDGSLKTLTINGEQINLEKCTNSGNNYGCKFDYDGKGSLEVEAVLNDSQNFQISKEDGSNIEPTATGGTGNFGIQDLTTIMIVIKPKNSESGASTITYTVEVTRDSDTPTEPEPGTNKPDDTPNDTPNDTNDNTNDDGSKEPTGGGNVPDNPGTGGISMFIMTIILTASLVGSVYLYQKNMESYK